MIGDRIVRTEDPALLTGRGRFIDNIDIAGAVHVVYVRSQVAHARIVDIDIAEAARMPGVLGVFTAADIDLPPFLLDMPWLPSNMPRPALASVVVRYVSEPIVAVVAETLTLATDAAQAVVVDYDTLPSAVTIDQGFADEVLLFPEAGTNVCVNLPGAPIDFSECEVVVRADINNQRVAPSPMEGRVAASRWEPDGRLTHWQSCQGAHPMRAKLAEWYGLDVEQIRVIVPDVGGGFGAKAVPYPEDQLLPWLAKTVGRPVRFTETRSESMNGIGHGRAQRQHIEIGGTRDGNVSSYRLTVEQDAGAYPRVGAFLPFMTHMMLTGAYDIPNAAADSRAVLTNTVPTVAYRGAGRPEAAAAIERAMDLFAAEIGMDPIELRRKNLVAPDRFPFTTPAGTTYDTGDYEGGLDTLLAAADYAALRAEQHRRREAGDTIQIGIGVSVYVEVTSPMGGSEVGEVLVAPAADGSGEVDVTVITGTTPFGQGHDTTWAMLVADRLGVPFERITVVHGDTDLVRSSEITGGSRSVQVGGTNIVRAANAVADQACAIAARLLEADVADVVLEDGRFHVAGAPAITRTWLDVARASIDDSAPLFGEGDFLQAGGTFPSGAHLAVVEIDIETGRARLRDLVAVDDAGKIINPLLAEGQIHGGLAQGAAQALFEEVVYDDDGNPLTSNFADYGIVSAAELPSFRTIHVETPTPLNDLGAKGIGESGTVGSTPAVQSAVIDAVSHLGVTHIDMPCTPNRVWTAIHAAAAGGTETTLKVE